MGLILAKLMGRFELDEVGKCKREAERVAFKNCVFGLGLKVEIILAVGRISQAPPKLGLLLDPLLALSKFAKLLKNPSV